MRCGARSRSHRSDGGKQIKSRRHWSRGEDTFAISASSAICAAAGKLRQSQPKCIVLVELKEISTAAAACFSLLHPFTQQIYTIRSFTSTSRCRCSFSCLHRKSVCHRQKERVRERASERVNSLQKRARDGEMEREGGAGRKEGREGECNFSTKCSSSRIVARSRSICEKEKGAPSE